MSNDGYGSATRLPGGTLARFRSVHPHGRKGDAALSAKHPAVREARTLFPTTVVSAEDAPRLLVPGFNSAKIGGRIRRGPWSGLPVFTLTLEERATCPTSCGLWRECYGNAMPLARRHAHGDALIDRLGVELTQLLAKHRGGIAVRLHVLGDFWSEHYALMWMNWVLVHPKLHVWGYTAHAPDSEIGKTLQAMNVIRPDRWSMRFSVPPDSRQAPRQATTIWRQPEDARVPEGLVCPASSGRTQACSTCGLCWAPEAAGDRIVFIGHGMSRRRGPRVTPDNPVARQIDGAGGVKVVARRLGMIVGTLQRWRKTGYVPPYQRAALDRATAP